MTRETIIDQLSPIIDRPSDIEIIWLGENQFISVDDFLARFGSAELTFANLTEHPQCTEGWNVMFQNWKDEGYIT